MIIPEMLNEYEYLKFSSCLAVENRFKNSQNTIELQTHVFLNIFVNFLSICYVQNLNIYEMHIGTVSLSWSQFHFLILIFYDRHSASVIQDLITKTNTNLGKAMVLISFLYHIITVDRCESQMILNAFAF